MLDEVAPPGWGHTKAEKEKTKPNKPKSKIGGSAAAFDRARKEGRFKGSKEDMFKLMWWMKNKGGKPKGKPHYKPGTDEKYKKYQEEKNYEQRDKELKKTSSARNQRYKTLHNKTGDGNTDVNEEELFYEKSDARKRADHDDHRVRSNARMKHGKVAGDPDTRIGRRTYDDWRNAVKSAAEKKKLRPGEVRKLVKGKWVSNKD